MMASDVYERLKLTRSLGIVPDWTMDSSVEFIVINFVINLFEE
jgi:hypothetical protein